MARSGFSLDSVSRGLESASGNECFTFAFGEWRISGGDGGCSETKMSGQKASEVRRAHTCLARTTLARYKLTVTVLWPSERNVNTLHTDTRAQVSTVCS